MVRTLLGMRSDSDFVSLFWWFGDFPSVYYSFTWGKARSSPGEFRTQKSSPFYLLWSNWSIICCELWARSFGNLSSPFFLQWGSKIANKCCSFENLRANNFRFRVSCSDSKLSFLVRINDILMKSNRPDDGDPLFIVAPIIEALDRRRTVSHS